LAAVLWNGGISFGGVVAFIFADLIVLPILAIYRKYYGAAFALRITALMYVTMVVAAYRKYYGTAFALRITALMFVTIVIAALTVDGLFSLAGIVPTDRPDTDDVFAGIQVNYKLVLNVIALFAFAWLMNLTMRRSRPGASTLAPAHEQ
jgi:hypothetical protein